MITSTYGVKLPEDGDKGQPVFNAINSNFQILRDHTHNGVNSAKIASSDLAKSAVNIDKVNWVASSGGIGYEQTVTLPGVYTIANCTFRFRIRTGANQSKIIHPTVIPSSLTQFKVIVNDSDLDLEVLFV